VINTEMIDDDERDPLPAGQGLARARQAVAQQLSRRKRSAYVDVTMLGPTGVGKTTMLASLYECFRRVVGPVNLDIVPAETATSVTLGDYLTELRQSPQELKIKAGKGTSDVREYIFDVGRRGRKPLFKIRFTDYPGAYFVQPEQIDPAEKEKVDKAFRNADVVIVAIDAAALLEHNGDYNEKFNRSLAVNDEIYKMLRDKKDRLIILAPLKCEKYMGSPTGIERLERGIDDLYKPTLLNHIKGDELVRRVGCVLTPVQSIGSVVFNRIDMVNGEPEFVFLSTRRGATYSPKDTDQPLRYALRFIVGKYRATANPARRQYQRLMGTDAVLVAAMEEFGSRCKAGDGFAVLQPHRFLRSEP
jgi:GTPase SAR1 family protein